MVQIIKKSVLSSDNVHMLNGYVYIPEGEVKGLFQLVHGMCEYTERYHEFMLEIANHGYIVFGYDHLGHGKTATDDSELGYIADKDGWKLLVDDVAVFGKAVKNEYGSDLPYILMGHSMGSFIVRLSAEKYNMHDKLIIMGTGGPNPAATPGLAAIAVIKKVKGGRYISNFLQNLAFGTYNKRFEGDGTYGWLSNYEDVRNSFAADKFCNFRFTVSAMGDLVTLNKESNTSRWFKSGVTKKPILLVSGADDPVGDYGKGPKAVHDKLKANGADIKFVLYRGCRHEILNDKCRNNVIAEILNFIK